MTSSVRKLTFTMNTQLDVYADTSALRIRSLHARMIIHSRYIRIHEYGVGCYTFQLLSRSVEEGIWVCIFLTSGCFFAARVFFFAA